MLCDEEKPTAEWDEFVLTSSNGNWLQTRKFLRLQQGQEKDRYFTCRDASGHPLARISGRLVDGRFVSHPKSTYGGVIFKKGLGVSEAVQATRGLLNVVLSRVEVPIAIRTPPSWLNAQGPEDDMFSLLYLGGAITRTTLSTVLPRGWFQPSSNRMRQIRKAESLGIRATWDVAAPEAYELISRNLERHGVTPTHTESQFEKLLELSDWVSLVGARDRQHGLASVIVLFHLPGAVHMQYIASDDEQRKLGALDVSVLEIVKRFGKDCNISFGISTSGDGKSINDGLFKYKNSWGSVNRLLTEISLDITQKTVQL